ncbi:hypothetical protein [Aphanothece sacrum]|uniref:Uncharacterized protein n=1 Tax=Aphanothece sacrum FPU1 TaxID=1920663 RepID=A0A401IDR5_APHSA|nr:hypothetical protein [Aphanothece sacrum]GBF79428.1 hypothetical protein AsFPU1_0823 [Aphanothece sacrum FPU1]GBF86643.1 hypothetical protein AsFPU3_3715 [Aphanothece sacrum FPU3]
MKSLMDVIKTLIKINGVLALLTLIAFIAMREKEPKMMSEASQFRRDLQAMPSEDQQKIANIEAKLEEKNLSSADQQQIAENLQKIAQLQDKLREKTVFLEEQRKLAEYNEKIANLQAKSQANNLSSEELGQMAEYNQKIANLQAKFQEKDQQIQQLQRHLTAYQQSQTAQRDITKTEIASNLAKNTTQNSSFAAQAQLNPQPRPIASFTPTNSPVQLSQRSQSEYELSKNRFPQNLAFVPPKTEITPNLASSSTPKTIQKQPTAIESNANIAMISVSNEFLQEDTSVPKQQKPVSDQLEQENKEKSSFISKKKTPRDQSIHMANDLAAGLQVADKKKHIKYGTWTYNKVQTAIGSLRRGSSTTLQEAAQMSGLDPSVLAQVVKWGENRPGTF